MKPERSIRFYPKSWRERYGAEMCALIEQSEARGWRVSSDLVRGCIGAWLMLPFGGRRPLEGLIALFGLVAWAGGLALLALLTIWLKPQPTVWRVWVAVAAQIVVMARLFTKRLDAGRRALAPELATFEAVVLVIVTLVAGTILHKPAPVEGLAHARDWLIFVLDPARMGIANVWLIFGIMRLVWPRGFAALEEQNRPSTSTLGLSG